MFQNHQPVFYKQTQDTLHIRTKASCRRWCVDWAQPAYTLIASASREDLLQNMGSAVSIRGREGRQVLVIFLVYVHNSYSFSVFPNSYKITPTTDPVLLEYTILTHSSYCHLTFLTECMDVESIVKALMALWFPDLPTKNGSHRKPQL